MLICILVNQIGGISGANNSQGQASQPADSTALASDQPSVDEVKAKERYYRYAGEILLEEEPENFRVLFTDKEIGSGRKIPWVVPSGGPKGWIVGGAKMAKTWTSLAYSDAIEDLIDLLPGPIGDKIRENRDRDTRIKKSRVKVKKRKKVKTTQSQETKKKEKKKPLGKREARKLRRQVEAKAKEAKEKAEKERLENEAKLAEARRKKDKEAQRAIQEAEKARKAREQERLDREESTRLKAELAEAHEAELAKAEEELAELEAKKQEAAKDIIDVEITLPHLAQSKEFLLKALEGIGIITSISNEGSSNEEICFYSKEKFKDEESEELEEKNYQVILEFKQDESTSSSEFNYSGVIADVEGAMRQIIAELPSFQNRLNTLPILKALDDAGDSTGLRPEAEQSELEILVNNAKTQMRMRPALPAKKNRSFSLGALLRPVQTKVLSPFEKLVKEPRSFLIDVKNTKEVDELQKSRQATYRNYIRWNRAISRVGPSGINDFISGANSKILSQSPKPGHELIRSCRLSQGDRVFFTFDNSQEAAVEANKIAADTDQDDSRKKLEGLIRVLQVGGHDYQGEL